MSQYKPFIASRLQRFFVHYVSILHLRINILIYIYISSLICALFNRHGQRYDRKGAFCNTQKCRIKKPTRRIASGFTRYFLYKFRKNSCKTGLNWSYIPHLSYQMVRMEDSARPRSNVSDIKPIRYRGRTSPNTSINHSVLKIPIRNSGFDTGMRFLYAFSSIPKIRRCRSSPNSWKKFCATAHILSCFPLASSVRKSA